MKVDCVGTGRIYSQKIGFVNYIKRNDRIAWIDADWKERGSARACDMGWTLSIFNSG